MPNPDSRAPKPDTAAPSPHPGAVVVDDRPVMIVGILAFGVTIPFAIGLYGPLRPDSARWWLGFFAFIALAAAVWFGNRWLLFKQREHFNWFANPWRKLMLLVTANVLYTAPLSAGAIAGWFHLAGLPVDDNAITLVVLTNVICVLFVTHAYETVFLIRERESDLLQVERLQRMRSQAELAALKAQVDPHFLFNSLNTLGHLILRDPPRGREFCDLLAEVYRYVLASREHDLVPLAHELAFLRAYHRLLVLRFGGAVQLELDEALATTPGRVPPLALQTLLENAVKHNRSADHEPLHVRLQRRGDRLQMSNPMHARSSLRPGAGLGLANLDERCRLLTGRALEVVRDGGRFEVCVPMVLGSGS